ncbi:hypothetical protein KSF78_0002020 [Schistosoma japonicum]|nr:hypothetical protein KSF78_0002020 [Schistosoma japonicum]
MKMLSMFPKDLSIRCLNMKFCGQKSYVLTSTSFITMISLNMLTYTIYQYGTDVITSSNSKFIKKESNVQVSKIKGRRSFSNQEFTTYKFAIQFRHSVYQYDLVSTDTITSTIYFRNAYYS